jgi:threonine dehydrogenase-like Zn-dependent dehydrogenase/ActR/RegA family two-component response regulator
MRVFVADDNIHGLEEYETYLKYKGCKVIIADSIDKALSIISDKRQVFDIAILDMVFPRYPRGGLVLLQEIKRKRPEVECIILTAFTGNYENAVICMAAGAFTYIDRTAELDRVYALLEQAYALKEGIQFNPDIQSEDMWVLGMPPKVNTLSYMKAPLPRYKRNEVIVKTLHLGVCGTDVHTFSSGKPCKRSYPLIEFHEALGEVVAKGADVDDATFSIGDWVIPMVRRCQKWNRTPNSKWDFHVGYCDHWQGCPNHNHPDMCPHRPGYLARGTGKYHGFGSEYFSDSQDYLIKVTEEQKGKLSRLCVLTEPLSVSWKVIREIEARRGIAKLRDRVLVVGIGPIGMLCIAILYKMYPGTEIYAIDLFKKHHKVSMINKHFKKYVKYKKVSQDKEWPDELTKQHFDIIIDATGDIADVFPKMCNIVSPEGILALLSVSDEASRQNILQLETAVFDKIVTNEVRIIGSVCASRKDMEDSLRFMLELCNRNFLNDLVFPKKVISPKGAPDSIRNLCGNKEYLKILIST